MLDAMAGIFCIFWIFIFLLCFTCIFGFDIIISWYSVLRDRVYSLNHVENLYQTICWWLCFRWHGIKNNIVLSALWCFDLVSFHSYPPGLLNCHLDNRAFLPVQVKQPRPHYIMHICVITIPLHMCVRYFHTIVSTGHLICRYNRPDTYQATQQPWNSFVVVNCIINRCLPLSDIWHRYSCTNVSWCIVIFYARLHLDLQFNMWSLYTLIIVVTKISPSFSKV